MRYLCLSFYYCDFKIIDDFGDNNPLNPEDLNLSDQLQSALKAWANLYHAAMETNNFVDWEKLDQQGLVLASEIGLQTNCKVAYYSEKLGRDIM